MSFEKSTDMKKYINFHYSRNLHISIIKYRTLEFERNFFQNVPAMHDKKCNKSCFRNLCYHSPINLYVLNRFTQLYVKVDYLG